MEAYNKRFKVMRSAVQYTEVETKKHLDEYLNSVAVLY